MHDLKSLSLSASAFSGLAAASIVALGLVAVIPSPADANPRNVVVTAPRQNPDMVTRRVQYRDLDLASLEGEEMLNRRVGGAVRSICLEVTGRTPILLENMRCRSDAWSSARPQISRAVQRAHDLAMTGTSTISAAAITISFEKKALP